MTGGDLAAQLLIRALLGGGCDATTRSDPKSICPRRIRLVAGVSRVTVNTHLILYDGDDLAYAGEEERQKTSDARNSIPYRSQTTPMHNWCWLSLCSGAWCSASKSGKPYLPASS